jgi:Domain of unknown function (DUF5605)/Protein of unknown function (DUF4038)/Domain of unknown function (DUF5060)
MPNNERRFLTRGFQIVRLAIAKLASSKLELSFLFLAAVASAPAFAADPAGTDSTKSTATSAENSSEKSAAKKIDQWGMFEIELKGPAEGNPFVDVNLSATFSTSSTSATKESLTSATKQSHVTGFYDGNGTYRIRFMPNQPGEWNYVTSSNRPELNGKQGTFTVVEPSKNNHGPVRVHNTYNFAYADGTPYIPFGTTCYAWIHQSDELQQQTLATLKESPFNKIRMCVFPKWYDHNRREPALYPFEGAAPNHWDFTKFNPAFFQHLEERISQLNDLGIEADLILFHPYDGNHWGFDHMPAADDDRYLRYIVARLSAYKNVWWSLANEFDLLKNKKDSDWDRFFQIIAENDPYQHLRSVHNCRLIYNNTNPLVTHASIQNGSEVEDVGRAQILRDVYRKPVVYDEVKYEGNLPARWGNLSADDLVNRFWNAIIAGTYATHGETYLDPEHDNIWWSHGGVLHGESPKRIAFLRSIVEAAPPGIEQIDPWQDMRVAGKRGEYYLVYFGKETPTEWSFDLPATKLAEPMKFRVELIDAWNMTIAPVDGVFQTELAPNKYRIVCPKQAAIKMPGKPYMALRITRVHE